MTDRPPYSIPSMAEIAARKGTNGRTVVSTFSGCGGSCLGFEMAGYRVLAASEFVAAARETYRANHPGVPIDDQDIRLATAQSLRELAGVGPDFEVDVLEGSPPCASFSMAGRREKLWGKTKKYSDRQQRVDDLFFEFARILRDLRPRAFVAENVPGLDAGEAKEKVLGTPQVGMFSDDHESTVYHTLCDAGYRVAYHILNAADYGVPQNRRRLIFVGIREDLGVAPSFPPKSSHRYSISDACPWIQRVVVHMETSGFANKGDRVYEGDGQSPSIMAGGVGGRNLSQYHVEAETDIERFAIGREWDRIGGIGQSEKYFQLVRPDPDKPCPTITATAGSPGAASVVHPTEKRKFSTLEVRRLCGFPDDFVLKGTYTKQIERLGRAVPPPLMAAVASHVAKLLDEADAKEAR